MSREQNQAMIDAAVRHRIGQLRVANRLTRELAEIIGETEADVRLVVEQVLDQLETYSLQTVRGQNQVERLVQKLRELRGAAWDEAAKHAEREIRAGVIGQWEWLAAAGAAAAGVRVSPMSRPRSAARRLVRRTPAAGRPLGQWMRDARAADMDRIRDAVVSGVVLGTDRRSILRSVFGSAAGGRRDGVAYTAVRNIDGIIRTAQNAVSTEADRELADRNDGIFNYDIFVAVLDNRTTATCRSLDGTIYPRGDGVFPPLHFGCRSVRVPIFSRQSPKRETYSEWLRRQPVSTQNEVLGTAKAKLFRDGQLPLSSFVDDRGREYTLSELARRDAEAFRQAGLDPDRFRS